MATTATQQQAATEPEVPPVREVTDAQWAAMVDRAARHFLNLSGEAFLRQWRAGEFDDEPDRPDVMAVASLVWFERSGRLLPVAGRTPVAAVHDFRRAFPQAVSGVVGVPITVHGG